MRISIRPGIPDDRNRHYLPEALKHSDIVVNENGNNSQPYPERLREHHGVIADGVEDRWYTYVPAGYDGAVPVPLVVSLHGGLMTGWGQAVYTSWTTVADREGFIVVFPDASRRRFWTIDLSSSSAGEITTPRDDGMYLNAPPADPEENHDLRFLRGLIDRISEEFSIDRHRVFMQGMSMGNAMTMQFARHFGDVLAGAAGSGGPTDPALLFDANGEPINGAGPVAVWESRLDLDTGRTHFADDISSVVEANREYWLRVNGVTAPPQIAVRGVDNFAFYRGKYADVVFRDVHNRDHGQTFDDAELVWDYLFSGTRRDHHGAIRRTAPLLERTGDSFAIAAAEGCRFAWVSGQSIEMPTAAFLWQTLQYHGRGGDALQRGTYLYVPLRMIADALSARLDMQEDGSSATLTMPTGEEFRFARGSIACVRDGRVVSMLAEAVTRDAQLCISVEWLAAHAMNLHVSVNSNVVYVTDHHAQLSNNMARLLRNILG